MDKLFEVLIAVVLGVAALPVILIFLVYFLVAFALGVPLNIKQPDGSYKVYRWGRVIKEVGQIKR